MVDAFVNPDNPGEAILNRDMCWGMFAFKLMFLSSNKSIDIDNNTCYDHNIISRYNIPQIYPQFVVNNNSDIKLLCYFILVKCV